MINELINKHPRFALLVSLMVFAGFLVGCKPGSASNTATQPVHTTVLTDTSSKPEQQVSNSNTLPAATVYEITCNPNVDLQPHEQAYFNWFQTEGNTFVSSGSQLARIVGNWGIQTYASENKSNLANNIGPGHYVVIGSPSNGYSEILRIGMEDEHLQVRFPDKPEYVEENDPAFQIVTCQ